MNCYNRSGNISNTIGILDILEAMGMVTRKRFIQQKSKLRPLLSATSTTVNPYKFPASPAHLCLLFDFARNPALAAHAHRFYFLGNKSNVKKPTALPHAHFLFKYIMCVGRKI